MVTSLYQIAKNTFRESLREPIYLLVVLSALTLIGSFPLFTLFVFDQQVKLVVDSAMATVLVFGWVVAVLCASPAIAREINNGTVLLLLSKPVPRPVFILGKILGILTALVVFWVLTGLASLISVRVAVDEFRLDYRALWVYFGAIIVALGAGGIHNYISRSSFPMAAVVSLAVVLPLAVVVIHFLPHNGAQLPYEWRMIPALVLVLYAVWAMGTLATALSTRFELIGNMLICSVVFVVGLMSDYLLGNLARAGSRIAAFLYACVPNWQLFWMADALASERTIPLEYLLLSALYIALFLGLFVVLAVALFWKREVGEQSVN